DNFWDQSKAIYVWSAGNSGDDTTIGKSADNVIDGVQRPEATMMLRADTMVKVGAGFFDKVTGRKYVESYSSLNSPSFVVTNPYYDGFLYPYFKDEAGVRARLDEYFAKTIPGTDKTAEEAFFQALQKLAPAELLWMGDPLQRCHVNFEKADFE